VYSASSGVVINATKDCGECKTGFGAHVKIRSKDPSTNISYVIVYGHLQNMSVAVEYNQTVAAGDLLGLMGDTGHSDGTHLHFEVRKNENYLNRVDPYDIYSDNVSLYPGQGYSVANVSCGQNFLWTECPPVPR
jgi:murein DD-endopeptidase MepM/ murein hydrolase activator NlpD